MAELTKDELWVIRVYFGSRGFGHHRILDIRRYLQQLGFHHGEQVIESLLATKVLDRSPDGESVKFTDYGVGLYRATIGAQEKWESEPYAKVAVSNQDEVLIRAGETYLANHLLREIFADVRKEVAVIDAYVDTPLFDYLMPLGDQKRGIKIITSDKILALTSAAKSAMLAYKAFRTQYPTAEMRTIAGDIHDRFILQDRKSGFHVGHSIKDLGKKDTRVNRITDVPKYLKLFDDRWEQARPIP